MYWLDTVILVFLAVGAGLGAWTGLVKQIVRILGFIAALLGAIFLHGWAANWLQQTFLKGADAAVSDALAYVTVFVVIFAAFVVTAMAVERGIKAAKLKWLDRLLGAGVGATKAALIMGAIFLAVIEFPHPSTQDAMKQSAIAPVLAAGVGLCVQLVPAQYTGGLRDGLDKLKETANAKAKEIRDKPPLPLP
jgi:membrane protein required for colicin V production